MYSWLQKTTEGKVESKTLSKQIAKSLYFANAVFMIPNQNHPYNIDLPGFCHNVRPGYSSS